MIKFINVYKNFQNNEILKNINLEIAKGEFIFLYGSGTSGKTSLLKSIYLEEKIDSGMILVDDINISKLKSSKIQKMRSRFGVVFQDNKLLNSKTVLENIILPLKIRKIPKQEIKKRTELLLKKFNLVNVIDKYPFQISISNIKKTSFCRAIILEPEILILDEPTSNLDEIESKKLILHLLEYRLKKNPTIIYATNLKHILCNRCDRVIYFKNGEIEKITKGYAGELDELDITDII